MVSDRKTVVMIPEENREICMRGNYCRAFISLCSPLESSLQFYGLTPYADLYILLISWWWAIFCPKHVETEHKWNIYLLTASGWCFSFNSYQNKIVWDFVSATGVLFLFVLKPTFLFWSLIGFPNSTQVSGNYQKIWVNVEDCSIVFSAACSDSVWCLYLDWFALLVEMFLLSSLRLLSCIHSDTKNKMCYELRQCFVAGIVPDCGIGKIMKWYCVSILTWLHALSDTNDD